MPPSVATIARDQRTGPRTALAGYRAGCSLLDLALAENTSPEVARRVLPEAGIDPGPLRRLFANSDAARVANDATDLPEMAPTTRMRPPGL